MLKPVICGFAILGLALTSACGETPTKKTPRAADESAPYEPIKGNPTVSSSGSASASSGSTSSSGTTLTTGASVSTLPSAASAAPFTLAIVKDTTWASSCYRFSATGDYSKKYWAFTADTLTSLLVKYSDAACTVLSKNTDGTAKTWTTWVIGTLSSTVLSDNWAIVSGTCTKGCTAEYKSAFRATATALDEGSKISTTDSYNTADGKFVSYAKLSSKLDLEALATSLSSGTAAPTAGNTPSPSTPAVPTAPALPATGLGLISSLAGQSWTVCYSGKNTEGTLKVDRGFKRSLNFVKGADAASDSYTSNLVVLSNVDCTGDIITTKGALTYSNLLVSVAPIEGWILVETRLCAPNNCSAVKSYMKLPTATQGLAEAGENKTAATFYVDTPRIYTLNP